MTELNIKRLKSKEDLAEKDVVMVEGMANPMLYLRTSEEKMEFVGRNGNNPRTIAHILTSDENVSRTDEGSLLIERTRDNPLEFKFYEPNNGLYPVYDSELNMVGLVRRKSE